MYFIIPFYFQSPVKSKDLDEKQLAEKFIEFLEQDKQLASLIESSQNHHLRQKRQASTSKTTTSKNEIDEDTFESGGENEGFFDRAAKFVMELLQRFLKWVNA